MITRYQDTTVRDVLRRTFTAITTDQICRASLENTSGAVRRVNRPRLTGTLPTEPLPRCLSQKVHEPE